MSRLDEEAERAFRPRADVRDEELAAAYVAKEERRVVSIDTREPVDAQALASRALRFESIGDKLDNVSPPQWLIRDIVEQDSLLVIFGDPEAGKSFLAMDWAASIATGSDWNGFPVKQGPVLYINGEGHNGVNRRFKAWTIANDTPLAGAPLFKSTTTTALTSEMARAELEAVIAEFIREHGMPVLIVIDTLARNYGPGDENSTQDMVQAVATCDAIRELTRAVVALVHHSGHGDKGRARGSMVLKGALDAEYRMTRQEDSKDTLFECVKMKEGDRPAPIQFRFAAVEIGVKDDYGREVTSAVLRKTELTSGGLPTENSSKNATGRGRNQVKALDLLWSLQRQCMDNLRRAGRDPTEAHVSVEMWRDNCEAQGIPKKRFGEVKQSLLHTGKVRQDLGHVTPLAVE